MKLMAKNNFLLVNLNEAETKKLAEAITSETSRKILNYLAEKEQATEANMAKELNIPISTTHYHVQKLQEAKLVIAEEFHYSQKGREVNHYKLANKYIIIAPKTVSGLKQALKKILPAAMIAVGISAIIKLMAYWQSTAVFKSAQVEEAAAEVAKNIIQDTAPKITETAGQQPDIALWFFLGSIAVIAAYLVVELVKSKCHH